MSDPMTNTEVEDVLASIRRLVADDNRAEAKPVPQPPSDRLVLTPSLRVMEDVAPDALKQDVTDDASLHDVKDADVADDTPVAQDTDTDESVSETPDLDAYDDPDEQSAHAHEAEPDDSASDDDSALELSDDDVHDEAADVLVDDETHHIAEATPEPAPQSLSEKIAALETLVGARNDQFEPDDAGADAYAGTEPPAMAWEDADDATPMPSFSDVPPVTEDPDTSAQLFAKDEDVLDEDALRELVSDIVREELQGALGERITRNVRKLVRREIHRALAAQDLE